MIAALATCVLLAVAAPQRPGLDQRQGVTVPLDRKLQDELATARDFLEQGKAETTMRDVSPNRSGRTFGRRGT